MKKIMQFVFMAILFITILNAETLEEVVQEALCSNPVICGREKAYTATCNLVREAQADFLPQASVNYNIGPEEANNNSTRALLGGSSHFLRQDATLFVGQTIFDGGERSSFLKKRKAEFCQSYLELLDAKENIAFRASEVYVDVIRAREVVGIYDEDVKSHQDTYEKIQKKVEGGAGRFSEVQLAESRLALARTRLLQAEGGLREAINSFIEVVGRPPDLDQMTPPSMVSSQFSSLEEALMQAFCCNPRLKAAYANARAAKAQIGVSRSASMPKLSFDITWFHGNDLNGVPGSNVLVNGLFAVNWDFFTSGKIAALVRSDRARYLQSLCEIENTKRNIENIVATSFELYLINQARYVDLVQHRESSFEVYESYQKEFDLGTRSLFDLLNAQIEFYNARVGETQGVFDIYTDIYRLLASTGELVNYFGSPCCCE